MSFYVRFKRHNQRQIQKLPDRLQYSIYKGEYELKNANLIFIKTTFNKFKLTHLCKYNNGIQLLGSWTKSDILGPESYDD